jgi:adenine-specific DNA-methyltransferase
VGIAVGYMGTKRYLAGSVADVISSCKRGIVLDAFAGMCSVGEAVGSSRTVWNNDVQVFASEVAKALFTSKTPPPSAGDAVRCLFPDFCRNRRALTKRFWERLELEADALQAEDCVPLLIYQASASHVGNNPSLNLERRKLFLNPRAVPYRLATISFADGYFGLSQAIEIDSIRYAADRALSAAAIDADEHRWIVIALCQASAKVATTTGHFAQYMKPSEKNFKRFRHQRTKSVWAELLECLANLTPLGSTTWRRKNRVFRQDCLSLVTDIKLEKQRPSVVYADPPYTADHYSRYYHVWETLALYDYPESFGAGRYRPDRFVTPFSIKTTVAQSVERLVKGCRDLGADLVLSYPNNGLLQLTSEDPLKILKRSYRKVEIAHCIDYKHSTMGASKGASKNDVKEYIYLARP